MKKRKILTYLLIVLLLSLQLPLFFQEEPVKATSNVYYVATDGDDDTGDGSIGNPWATIHKALNESGDGDIVYVRGGNYNDIYPPTTGLRIGHENFTLKGYQNEVAVINGSGYTISSGYALLNIGGGSSTYNSYNITIANLVFENSNRDIIKVHSFGTIYSDVIILSNLTINNASYRGINFYSSNPNVHSINNSEVKDCWINNTQTSLSMGEGITFKGCQNVSFHDNLVTNCPKIMLDLVNGTKNCEIYNNTFVTTVGTAIKCDGSQSTNPSAPAYVSHVDIYNNTFYGSFMAIYIQAEKYGGCHNISIWGNVINLSNGSGNINAIKLAHSSVYGTTLADILIIYNTIYVENASNDETGVCLQIEIPQAYAKNFTIANDIFISGNNTGRQISSSKSNFSDSFLHFHNNCYNHTSKAPDTFWLDGAGQFEGSAILQSPEFVNIGTPDFHLNETSPCINNATSNYTVDVDFDGNARPYGGGYDIGAYEYQSSILSVTTNASTDTNETSATLHGYLEYDDGEICSVWFEYGLTDSYGDAVPDVYYNTSWSISASGFDAPLGITTDSNYIWIVDYWIDEEVYKYNMNGTYTTEHWDITVDGLTNPQGITTDGNYIWIVDSEDDEVYKYTMDGINTTEHWDTNADGVAQPQGITTDGNYIWIVDYNDKEVYKYTMDGTYTTEHWDTNAEGISGVGITTDGNYIWIINGIDNSVYKYTMNGTYTTEHWDTTVDGCIDAGAITNNEGFFWIVCWYNNICYQYFKYITVNTGDEFSTVLNNLSVGTLYHYRAVASNSDAIVNGTDVMFLTLPNVTASGYANTTNVIDINVSWITGDGANATYLERNTTSSWSRGTGTFLYNGTGTYYYDNSTGENPLLKETTYYYRLWSYANWSWNESTNFSQWSDSSLLLSNITLDVDPPYNATFDYNVTSDNLTLYWDRGNYSDQELLVSRNDTFATSPDQAGNWILQNSSVTNWTGVTNITRYYSLWSWNETDNIYSSESLSMIWGGFVVNVMDENYPWIEISNYTLFITNVDGTETYYATGLNNPTEISYDDIPYGNNTIVQISHADYRQRVWYVDLVPSTYYAHIFYLPRKEIPDPGDPTQPDCVLRTYTDSLSIINPAVDAVISLTYTIEDMISVEVYNQSLYGTYGGWLFVTSDNYTAYPLNITISSTILDDNATMVRVSYYYEHCEGTIIPAVYYIRIVESYETELGVFDRAVEEAKVDFQRYINTTDEFESISILLTDANGYVNLYLIPSILYKVIIIKDGYVMKSADYTPAPSNEFGQTIEKVFRIEQTSVSPIYEEDNVFQNIDWSLEPRGVQQTSVFTIWFNITSSDCKLEWYRMSVWYYNRSNTTWILLDSQNETDACGGSINYTVPNVTGRYAIECFYKKANFTEFEIFQQGSLIMFFSQLRAGLEDFPDFAYYIILIVIMIAVMGFFYWFFGTGLATGYVGLIVFAIGLLMKPIEIEVGMGDPVSGWLIFAITFLVYTFALFLWSRI